MDYRNEYLTAVMPLGMPIPLRGGNVTYVAGSASNTVYVQQSAASCNIVNSTTANANDCGLSMWPNINQVPYGGIKQGVDSVDSAVVRIRARILFDGAIVTMNDLHVISNKLQVGGYSMPNYTERSGGYPVREVKDTVTRWRIQYVDNQYAINDQQNNCFRLITVVGSQTAYNIPAGYYGYDFYANNAMNVRASYSPQGPEAHYYFAFQGGAIAGLMSLGNPGYLLSMGTAEMAISQNKPLTQESLYFNIVTPSAFMSTMANMTIGECCTKGFGAATTEAKVCAALGLIDGGKTVGLCNTYLIDSKTGWCKTNAESSICVDYCQRPDINCDTIYSTYCANQGPVRQAQLAVCGCFMGEAFYTKYNQALSDAGLGILASGPAAQPACNYMRCVAQSAILPFTYKTPRCPAQNISVCLSQINVDNYGSINGGVSADTLQTCGVKPDTGSDDGSSSGGGTSTSERIVAFVENNAMWFGIGLVCLIFFMIISTMITHGSKRHTSRKHGHKTATGKSKLHHAQLPNIVHKKK
jgi:hypothetical protein